MHYSETMVLVHKKCFRIQKASVWNSISILSHNLRRSSEHHRCLELLLGKKKKHMPVRITFNVI